MIESDVFSYLLDGTGTSRMPGVYSDDPLISCFLANLLEQGVLNYSEFTLLRTALKGSRSLWVTGSMPMFNTIIAKLLFLEAKQIVEIDGIEGGCQKSLWLNVSKDGCDNPHRLGAQTIFTCEDSLILNGLLAEVKPLIVEVDLLDRLQLTLVDSALPAIGFETGVSDVG